MGAVLMLLGALAATPALSQELGLKHGQKSLDSGDYEAAVRQLSATVNDKDSTLQQAAKALYLRGVAYRRGGNPSRAIADLGAAVWLGLSGTDKARALVNKGLAFRAVGMSSQAESAIAQARQASGQADQFLAQESRMSVASTVSSPVSSGSVGESTWSRFVPSLPSFGSSSSSTSTASAPAAQSTTAAASQSTETATRTAEAAPTTGWGAEVNAPSEGNAVSRWFGSFGGQSAPTPPSTPSITSPSATTAPTTTASRTTTTTRTAPPPAPPSAESWAANTSAQRESESGTAVGRWFSRQTTSAPAPAAQPAAAPRGRGYTVQLANSRSESEAQALLRKAKSASGQGSARIEKVDIGSFGTFYSVKFGPYATSAEGTKVCNAMKRRGTDCSVISPDGP